MVRRVGGVRRTEDWTECRGEREIEQGPGEIPPRLYRSRWVTLRLNTPIVTHPREDSGNVCEKRIMSFGEAMDSGLRRHLDFVGRSSRSEFWYWVLFSVVAYIGFASGLLVASQLNILRLIPEAAGVLTTVFSLVLILGLAVGVRRLHDIDRSGWSLLIGLIPLIGNFFLIIWLATAGDGGANEYGKNPLARGLI